MIVVDGVALQPNLETPPSITSFWCNVIGEWVLLWIPSLTTEQRQPAKHYGWEFR